MPSLAPWEWTLFAVAAAVAVMSLVKLMQSRHGELLNQFRNDMTAEQQRRAAMEEKRR